MDRDPGLGRVLLPANRKVSLRIAVFAVSLSLLGFVTVSFIWVTEIVFQLGTIGTWLIYGLCFIAILGALLNGYANDDVIVSCAIAGGPLIGFGLFGFVAWLLTDLTVLSRTTRTALLAGAVTMLIGFVGALFGVWVGRRYGGRPSPPSSK